MTDLSSLSDAELQALYQPQPAPPQGGPTRITVRPEGAVDLSKMSDTELQSAYDAHNVSTLGDVAKSAGIGLVKGAIGLTGLPGDITELGARGLDFASRKISPLLGMEPPAERPNQDPILGNDQIRQSIENLTGKFYEPKTGAGNVAQTMGEFLPALVGGPETLGAKLLSRVAAPALASEGAGAVTKGTPLEPVARLGGAMLGGIGGVKLLAPKSIAAPTVEELGNAATAAYQHPAVAGLELHPSSTAFATDNITAQLQQKGFRELNAPQTFGVLQELKSPIGPTSKIADVQSVRTALGKVAGNYSNPTEAAAANKAIRGLDDYLSNLKPFDVAAGDGKAALAILNDAKGNYAAKMRSTRFDDAEYRAELNAASAHSGGNINNATRQALKSILVNPKKRRGFSDDEIAQMESVVKGTATGNMMRRVGKILSTQGMHGAAVLGTSVMAAPHTSGLSLLAPVAGFAAKKVADRSTGNAIRKLDDMIAMRSPLGNALPQVAPSTHPVVAGLLSSLIELRNQRTR